MKRAKKIHIEKKSDQCVLHNTIGEFLLREITGQKDAARAVAEKRKCVPPPLLEIVF